MYSKNNSTFTSVFNSAYRSTSENAGFFKNFTEQSRTGNERKIIETIWGIPEIKNLAINDFYTPKCNEEAEKYLSYGTSRRNDEQLFHITKALFAAEIKSGDRTLYFDALIRRIVCLFASKHFKKCLKDSRYMISLLNSQFSVDRNMYKIECCSYETRCLDILGETEEAKIAARNGIKEAKNFFQTMEVEGAAISDEKKLEILKSFLTVLNASRNTTEKVDAQTSRSRKTSLPGVSGERNKTLRLCSDAVTLKYDKTRGRHLVATRNIKTGSILIVDKPFAWSTDREMIDDHCLHCHQSLESEESIAIPCHNCQTVKFCSADCRLESWSKYHQWECLIFDYFYRMEEIQSSRLLLAYRTTVQLATGDIGAEIDRLSPRLTEYYSRDAGEAQSLEIGLNEVYDPLDYRTVYSLQTNSRDTNPKINLMHAIHAVLLAKCFKFVSKSIKPRMKIEDEEERLLAVATLRHLQAINSNAYEIVENVLDRATKIWEPRTIGGAIYPTVSLTNHSCFPNVVRHTYPKGRVVVRAIRFVRKGEEILDCYGPHFLRDLKLERQDYLIKKYNFLCACEACEKNLEPPLSPTLYKCKNCFAVSKKLTSPCVNCKFRIDRMKTDKSIKDSIEQRSLAIGKMLDGDHAAALSILLRHAELVDKIFSDYSFEAVKTQQALIQCFNSMGCVSE